MKHEGKGQKQAALTRGGRGAQAGRTGAPPGWGEELCLIVRALDWVSFARRVFELRRLPLVLRSLFRCAPSFRYFDDRLNCRFVIITRSGSAIRKTRRSLATGTWL